MSAYAQNSLTGRFQRPILPSKYFASENPKSPLMDFGLIEETTVGMFLGLWDNTCSIKTSQGIYEQLGGEKTVKYWLVNPIQGHVTWGGTSNSWNAENLHESIMINADL